MAEKLCEVHDTPLFIEVFPGMGAVDKDGQETQEKEYCPHCRIEKLDAQVDKLEREIERWRSSRHCTAQRIIKFGEELESSPVLNFAETHAIGRAVREWGERMLLSNTLDATVEKEKK